MTHQGGVAVGRGNDRLGRGEIGRVIVKEVRRVWAEEMQRRVVQERGTQRRQREREGGTEEDVEQWEGACG